MISFAVIIQARMNSSRLPGKTLMDLGGKSILQHQIDSIKKCPKVDLVIVATSDQSTDDPIYDYCKKNQIECFRGPLENVAKRFYLALEKYKPKFFSRFCADRPFYDWRILDKAFDYLTQEKAEICTNMYPATFPKGQTTEIISTELYLEYFPKMKDPMDLEHVTRYFYQHPQNFKITNLVYKDLLSTDKEVSSSILQIDNKISLIQNALSDIESLRDINLCIDTKEDFIKAEKVVSLMDKPISDYSWHEVVKLYKQVN